jgi:4-hydroxythreonine-4-phosphate dehydrogenase
MPISPSNKPAILITMGDPSGIGPEVVLKAVTNPAISRRAECLVIGDRFVMEGVRKSLGLKADIRLIDLANVARKDYAAGKTSPALGAAAIQYIDKALEMLKEKGASRLVTAPINKRSIREAGFNDFHGHTEYLARKTGTKEFGMMLVGAKLKVALVTRHVALSEVAISLTREAVYGTIMLTHETLRRDFGIRSPRIGVAGLNPHAGDGGLFGDEEERLIIPAMKKAGRTVKRLYGPLAPDAVFYDALCGRFDAVIAMYHDQALAPFKALYFRSGVNLTMGLPFIRTSPDHGTALDIAGKGRADPTSMMEAISLACRLRAPCSQKAS